MTPKYDPKARYDKYKSRVLEGYESLPERLRSIPPDVKNIDDEPDSMIEVRYIQVNQYLEWLEHWKMFRFDPSSPLEDIVEELRKHKFKGK
jgi:hypothetical protein